MSDEPLEPDDPRAQRRRVVEYVVVFLILCVVGPFVGNCGRHVIVPRGSRVPSTAAVLVTTDRGYDLVGPWDVEADSREGMLIGHNSRRQERGLFLVVHEGRWVDLTGWVNDANGEYQSLTPDELATLRPQYITYLRQNRPRWVQAFQGPDIDRGHFLWLNILAEGAILFWGLMPLWLGLRWCVTRLETSYGKPERFSHCPRCGYNIQHNAEPGCPECGWGRDGDEAAV
jgi:hypothetical protein